MRRLGAAAVDMSHVALGIAEAYWEYRLKPWDMAAGVLVISPPVENLVEQNCTSFSYYMVSITLFLGEL